MYLRHRFRAPSSRIAHYLGALSCISTHRSVGADMRERERESKQAATAMGSVAYQLRSTVRPPSDVRALALSLSFPS